VGKGGLGEVFFIERLHKHPREKKGGERTFYGGGKGRNRQKF